MQTLKINTINRVSILLYLQNVMLSCPDLTTVYSIQSQEVSDQWWYVVIIWIFHLNNTDKGALLLKGAQDQTTLV